MKGGNNKFFASRWRYICGSTFNAYRNYTLVSNLNFRLLMQGHCNVRDAQHRRTNPYPQHHGTAESHHMHIVYIRELYYQRGIKLPYFQTPSSRLQTFIIGRRHNPARPRKGPSSSLLTPPSPNSRLMHVCATYISKYPPGYVFPSKLSRCSSVARVFPRWSHFCVRCMCHVSHPHFPFRISCASFFTC